MKRLTHPERVLEMFSRAFRKIKPKDKKFLHSMYNSFRQNRASVFLHKELLDSLSREVSNNLISAVVIYFMRQEPKHHRAISMKQFKTVSFETEDSRGLVFLFRLPDCGTGWFNNGS